MQRTSVTIPCGNLLLEASVAEADGSDVAVLCHPHPQYGGNMDNNVVMALDECLFGMGFTTVRFNFRGVGRSTGNYGEGVAETEDLASVVDYAVKRGHGSVHLVGYSFGAWVVLNGLRQGLEAASTILVSPPLDFMDFQHLDLSDCPTLIVVGDSDSFCSAWSLRNWLDTGRTPNGLLRLEVLPGCDHFYWGFEGMLATRVKDFIRELPPRDGTGKSGAPDR